MLALDVNEHIDNGRSVVVFVSVPALPESFTEFDDTGLAVEEVFWRGQWLVPMLRRQRGQRKGIPGESPTQSVTGVCPTTGPIGEDP